MKKILILCDIFPPAFAPRMGYLCKYLPEHGWESVVITEYIPQRIYEELAENCRNVTYINYYHVDNQFLRKLKYAFVFIADFLFGYKDRLMTKIARKQIEKQPVSLILASAYRTFPLRTAHRLSQQYNLPLVVDLRDIIEQFPGNEHISKKITNFDCLNRIFADKLTRRLLKQRNQVLRDAHAVTTVSPWHVGFLKQFTGNIQLIYNGFDPALFIPQAVVSNEFRITYTGRLMSEELRDPSLLFEAVSSLYDGGNIEPESFRIQFYTDHDSAKALNSIAEKYRVAGFIDYFGYVSNHAIPKILNESSVLLLLANQSTGARSPKGIMTTKLFEYLAVEKPVLCVRSDEDCLEETIRETRSGIAATNARQVESFLLEKYAEWKQTGYTHQQTDRQKVRQFSRKDQATQFVRLFANLPPHKAKASGS